MLHSSCVRNAKGNVRWWGPVTGSVCVRSHATGPWIALPWIIWQAFIQPTRWLCWLPSYVTYPQLVEVDMLRVSLQTGLKPLYPPVKRWLGLEHTCARVSSAKQGVKTVHLWGALPGTDGEVSSRLFKVAAVEIGACRRSPQSRTKSPTCPW